MSNETWRDTAKQSLSKTYKLPVRDYSTFEWGRQENKNAVSVVVQREIAYQYLEYIRMWLPKSLRAFVGTTRWLSKSENSVEVVIAPCESQFDILKVAYTADYNGDQTTDDIIKRLKKFDSNFGIDIYHAGFDELLFRLKSMPQNLQEFIQDIDEFCPDAPSQVYGSIDLMIKEVESSHIVYLWWD